MPSALAITRSSGVVMNPRTRSAFAPIYAVVTRTTAISLRGYCRTLNARIDCSPAMRMTRLTTIARTGRLTNKSVMRMCLFLSDSPKGLCHLIANCLRWHRALALSSVVFRFRRRVVARLDLVVHEDGAAIAQLEHARRHDLIAWLPSGYHADLVTARSFELHKLVAHSAIRLSV